MPRQFRKISLDMVWIEHPAVEEAVGAECESALMRADSQRRSKRAFQLHARARHRHAGIAERTAVDVRTEDVCGEAFGFGRRLDHLPAHKLRIDPQCLAAPRKARRLAVE